LNNPLLIHYVDATTGKLTQTTLTFGNEITIPTYIHSQIFFSAIPKIFNSSYTDVAGQTVTVVITQQNAIGNFFILFGQVLVTFNSQNNYLKNINRDN
jgi:hypothetical protein